MNVYKTNPILVNEKSTTSTSSGNKKAGEFVNTHTVNTKQDEILKEFLSSIAENLEFFKKNIESKKRYEKLLVKWYFAAMVIDRFCFVVSLIYLIVTFVTFVMTMKNFYRLK